MQDITLEIAESALMCISPDVDRREWARMALALYDEFGDAGFDVWDRWSQGGKSYKAQDARSTWRSCARAGGASRAAIGTLIWAAQQTGWKLPTVNRTPSAEDVARMARERKRREQEREERRAAQEKAQAEDHAAAAAEAAKIWAASSPAPADHPYLVRKGISPEGLRWVAEWASDYEGEDGIVKRRVANALLLPIWSGPGRLSSLQAIFPDANNKLKRDRDYLRNGRKRGCYLVIGNITRDTHTIVVCEGYATGWSLHQALGWPVVVAFDAGNLQTVAEALRAKLGGARIVIAADNDQWSPGRGNPGVEAATRAAQAVAGIVVKPDFDPFGAGQPTDWDDMRREQGLDAIRAAFSAALNPPAPAPAPLPAPGEPDPAPAPAPTSPPPMDAVSEMESNGFFSVLGFDHDTYFFFQHERKQISRYTKGDFSKSGLIELAPIDWWETYFPAPKGGMDPAAAMNWLLRVAARRGIYDVSRIRGRGAWVDDGRMVYHHGGSLTVDGATMDVTKIRSRYVYELDRPLPDPADTPMGSDEGEMILDLAAQFRWSKPGSAALAAGWAALAPICGALRWRPHVWLTGGPGSGKSTVLNDFLFYLTGGLALFAQGNSTEAGIRQSLRADALPVLYDESEQNTEQERHRVQGIIALIRQSSTESQARTLKGSAMGEATAYHIRSMFCLASIQVGLRNQADTERISILSLRPKHEDADPGETWARLSRALANLRADTGLPSRLLRRAIDLLPVTLQNISVFGRAATERFGSVRDGDQYGTLLAGAWSLQSTEVASHDEALQWIDRYDWSEHRDQADGDTSEDALAVLMERRVRVTGSTEATVYELVREAAGLANTGLQVGQGHADAALVRHGIRVMGKHLVFANRSLGLQELMRGTPFEQDMRGLLLRLPGADRNNNMPMRIGGIGGKVVRIPLSLALPAETTGTAPF